jgi:hypothetical protein
MFNIIGFAAWLNIKWRPGNEPEWFGQGPEADRPRPGGCPVGRAGEVGSAGSFEEQQGVCVLPSRGLGYDDQLALLQA